MGQMLTWRLAGNKNRLTIYGAIVVDHKDVDPCGEPRHLGVGLIITADSRLSVDVVAAFLNALLHALGRQFGRGKRDIDQTRLKSRAFGGFEIVAIFIGGQNSFDEKIDAVFDGFLDLGIDDLRGREIQRILATHKIFSAECGRHIVGIEFSEGRHAEIAQKFARKRRFSGAIWSGDNPHPRHMSLRRGSD